MKRILIFILILLLSLPAVQAQRSKTYFEVPNKTTLFNRSIPAGTIVFEVDSLKFYRLTSKYLATDNMDQVFTDGNYSKIGAEDIGTPWLDPGWTFTGKIESNTLTDFELISLENTNTTSNYPFIIRSNGPKNFNILGSSSQDYYLTYFNTGGGDYNVNVDGLFTAFEASIENLTNYYLPFQSGGKLMNSVISQNGGALNFGFAISTFGSDIIMNNNNTLFTDNIHHYGIGANLSLVYSQTGFFNVKGGTGDALRYSIDLNGNHNFYSGSSLFGEDITLQATQAGGDVKSIVRNLSSDPNSHAKLYVRTENGDAKTTYKTGFGGVWSAGKDKTDGAYKWAFNSDGYLETDTKMTLDSTGILNVSRIKITPFSGSLSDGSPTDNELTTIIGITPAVAGNGYFTSVKDTDGTASYYNVWSNGIAWTYTELTTAL